MNKPTKKMLAKARSFVMMLTPKEIKTVLNLCGYKLNNSIVDDLGYPIPAITKFYDAENDEYVIEAKCISTEKNELNNTFKKLAPRLPYVEHYFSIDETTIVWLRDFYITELAIIPDQDKLAENQKAFAQFMYKNFGEHYKKEYNKNIRKMIKEQEKDKNNNGNSKN